jgi:hypothetical protein
MKRVIALALIMTFVMGVSPLFAQKTYNPSTALHKGIERGADSDHYYAKAPSQVLRGLHNVAFGWSDILTDLFQPPIGVGTALAPLTGPVTAVGRTLSGVLDLATFWVPGFNGLSITDDEEN